MRSPFATLQAPKLARNVKCQKDGMLNVFWRRVRIIKRQKHSMNELPSDNILRNRWLESLNICPGRDFKNLLIFLIDLPTT
jgi:hypothetical protein